MTAGELQVLQAFQAGVDERAAERVEPWAFGTALLSPSIAQVWDANYFRLEEAGASAESIAVGGDVAPATPPTQPRCDRRSRREPRRSSCATAGPPGSSRLVTCDDPQGAPRQAGGHCLRGLAGRSLTPSRSRSGRRTTPTRPSSLRRLTEIIAGSRRRLGLAGSRPRPPGQQSPPEPGSSSTTGRPGRGRRDRAHPARTGPRPRRRQRRHAGGARLGRRARLCRRRRRRHDARALSQARLRPGGDNHAVHSQAAAKWRLAPASPLPGAGRAGDAPCGRRRSTCELPWRSRPRCARGRA